MAAEPVPYETLVRFAVLHDRIDCLLGDLAKLDVRLGRWIEKQLGLANLPDEYADHVVQEFMAAADALEEASRDA